MIINAPISVGELFDKLSILAIKLFRIHDSSKLVNINAEYHALSAERMKLAQEESKFSVEQQEQLSNLGGQLYGTNHRLWQIEDDIRECEKNLDFGDLFVQLARSVYLNNDKRSSLKREINELFGSTIVEEKSYTDYLNKASKDIVDKATRSNCND